MKRLLPSRKELAIFAMLAVLLSGVVSLFQVTQHDLLLAGFAVPLFIFAAVLGLRRSPQWQSVPATANATTAEVAATAVETSAD
jgi:hypothetical protein